jgi:hypothetical protein
MKATPVTGTPRCTHCRGGEQADTETRPCCRADDRPVPQRIRSRRRIRVTSRSARLRRVPSIETASSELDTSDPRLVLPGAVDDLTVSPAWRRKRS